MIRAALCIAILLLTAGTPAAQTQTPLFETDFEGYRVSGYQILDASGSSTPIRFSTWGRPGEVTDRGMRLHLDVDENGRTPSGSGDLAYRCEMAHTRILETPMYTRMDVTAPADWRPDHVKNQDVLLQLHGTGVPNLRFRVVGSEIEVAMNIASTDWRDTVTSSTRPWGPGDHVLEVEWLATKGDHGYFRAWIDGEPVFDYDGPTMYASEKKDGLKVQMGLYKPDWDEASGWNRSREVGITTKTYFVTYFGDFAGTRSVAASTPGETAPAPLAAPRLLH